MMDEILVERLKLSLKVQKAKEKNSFLSFGIKNAFLFTRAALFLEQRHSRKLAELELKLEKHSSLLLPLREKRKKLEEKLVILTI